MDQELLYLSLEIGECKEFTFNEGVLYSLLKPSKATSSIFCLVTFRSG